MVSRDSRGVVSTGSSWFTPLCSPMRLIGNHKIRVLAD